ncbi:MAG: peptidoglycan-binding domain-containing protein [Acidobacteriaceae bacterium]|nr:peptidoglycan-binding domain-containing protein [Acidobacteriaceae bacterium]
MRFASAFVPAAALLVATCLPASAALHPHRSRASANIRHASSHSHKSSASVHHVATPSMDGDRASEIQTALIKKGYLSGAPSGQWDATSIAAMQKLQSDNGWQTKYTPDARALNALGLNQASNSIPSAGSASAEETAQN